MSLKSTNSKRFKKRYTPQETVTPDSQDKTIEINRDDLWKILITPIKNSSDLSEVQTRFENSLQMFREKMFYELSKTLAIAKIHFPDSPCLLIVPSKIAGISALPASFITTATAYNDSSAIECYNRYYSSGLFIPCYLLSRDITGGNGEVNYNDPIQYLLSMITYTQPKNVMNL